MPILISTLNFDRKISIKIQQIQKVDKNRSARSPARDRRRPLNILNVFQKIQTPTPKQSFADRFDFSIRAPENNRVSRRKTSKRKSDAPNDARSVDAEPIFARFRLRIPEAEPHFKFFRAIFAVFLKKRQKFSQFLPSAPLFSRRSARRRSQRLSSRLSKNAINI